MYRYLASVALPLVAVLSLTSLAMAGPPLPDRRPPSSYMPVVDLETFPQLRARRVREGRDAMAQQKALLAARYDLSNAPEPGAKMFRGKAVQGGIRVKLPAGLTWERLGAMSPAAIKAAQAFPEGFMPLPHVDHPDGGMVFPKNTIDEMRKQTARDLQRFDVDFDLPDQFMPEFPPPLFLVSRPDLGDISKGQLITLNNYYDLLNGILNPKDIEGFRLLVTPFPQQQFNATGDRRSDQPSQGVACFDCHVNGHTNGAFHLVGDQRPQERRNRIETTSLRGAGNQQIFGSQRHLHSVEDFTEFEQRAAYFDGDHVIAAKKGVNPLERGSQVHFMAEVQNLLDLPPAPKLRVADGKLDPALASAAEMRGQELFFGKALCAECHKPPMYMDQLTHDLKTERFFEAHEVNGIMEEGDGPVKTFTLRGIKDSPPYLHDGRLLTLADTVEFFNLVLETKLTQQEKADLVAFMLTL